MSQNQIISLSPHPQAGERDFYFMHAVLEQAQQAEMLQ